MDLSDQVWPKDKWKEFPMVQYYWYVFHIRGIK